MPFDNLSRQRLRLSDLVPKARMAGRVFHKLGLKPGDVIHISLPNTTEIFFPVFGAWLNKAIASMVDPTLTKNSCVSQIKDSKPKFIICHEGIRREEV